MALPATVGVPVPILAVLEDGAENQHPQTKIYAAGSVTPLATIDLQHKVEGRYEGLWTPTSPGTYAAHTIVYSDLARTTENIAYTREVEQIFATNYGKDDLAAMLIRTLGMVHENAFIDNTIHDIDGQLLAARVRIFDSKDNVELATDGGAETTGLIAVYEMSTSYESKGQMGSYRMKRVQ